MKLLDGYRGIVQATVRGLQDHRRQGSGKAITLAFCWAHLRRHFFDIAKGGDAPIASEALERIAAIYAIEKKSAARAPTIAVPCARTRASRWSSRSRRGSNISSPASPPRR